MPILGILASAITGNLLTTAYASIATVTVGSGGAANVEFTSIPSTFTHLQLRTLSKTNNANANDAGGLNTTFNSDTTTSYSYHYILGTGSSVSAGNGNTNNSFVMGFTNSNNYPASNFSGSVIDILDYKNTNKYKTVRAIGGNDGNGAGFVWLNSGLWQNTNAVSSITINPWSGSFMEYTTFALYGIKGV